MTPNDMSRIREEQATIERMIRLYCRSKEGNAELCPACEELRHYALARLDRCPFGERKTTCRPGCGFAAFLAGMEVQERLQLKRFFEKKCRMHCN